MTHYPKRLIEVDLPIKEISRHARREKSIRHGHISTFLIWWARRPLAACRAVFCASILPDPAPSPDDTPCPQKFVDDAKRIMGEFWDPMKTGGRDLDDPLELRRSLLDFIADFANWDNSTDERYLKAARALTQSAHEALGGIPGTRPLVVDPFAGGGAIPLEALRVGADAFASDLNPVAVLLNKVVLEYIPRYGQTLADEVRRWGAWIKEEAERELGEFYPKDPDGAVPIAYLWARTITCEGPGCGAEVPLMRSMWLAKKTNRSVALRIVPKMNERRVELEILEDVMAKDVGEGTVRRGSATCPVCGYTTPVASVRKQLKPRRGGAADARLFAVVTTRPGRQGRFYRLPNERDLEAVQKAASVLERRKAEHSVPMSLVPDEPLPPPGVLGFRVQRYGMEEWGNLFTPRQALALTTLARLVREAGEKEAGEQENGLAAAVQACLALAASRQTDYTSSLCSWHLTGEKINHTFGRQALPMIWDFTEVYPLSGSTGDFRGALEWVARVCEANPFHMAAGGAELDTAIDHPLPDEFAKIFFTDPPYYDAVPYSDLSDFFYVWLKRTLPKPLLSQFSEPLTPKDDECIVDEVKGKDRAYFESTMTQALAEGRRVLAPDGIGVVVFANKSTAGWEALLQALLDAGWIITASWPIDTEMGTRLRAMNSAALASSVHLVCRPRENPDGTLKEDVGDWRDVLAELPKRIHDWLPRLAKEGVVGADAIFSCLGPALEIYSRYSKVEKASGEVVLLGEYLVEVWAAVSREALNMLFEGADTTGFEEDARITAMWLWTLSTGSNGNSNGKGNGGKSSGGLEGNESDEGYEGEEAEEEKSFRRKGGSKGFFLEFDAASKIAQGLGAHLEKMPSVVEVKGSQARLIPVAERARYLFEKAPSQVGGKGRKTKKKEAQTQLLGTGIEVVQDEADGGSGFSLPPLGKTALDRLHQAMLLHADERSDSLKRFIIEEVGQDQSVWKLAQSLSAIYPPGSDERNWIEAVLLRKKVLNL